MKLEIKEKSNNLQFPEGDKNRFEESLYGIRIRRDLP